MKHKQNSKGFAALIVLVVIVILLLASLVYSFIPKKNQVFIDVEKEKVSVDQTSEWKQYSSPQMGITLEYPQSWQLNTIGEANTMNKIIIESPCDTDSDKPCATLSITPEDCNSGAICQEIETGSDIKTIYSYEDGTKSNITKSTIGGTNTVSFDYNDNPIRSSDNLYLERVYSFVHRGITYEMNYYETYYQRDIYVVSPLSWVYIGAAEKIIESVKLD